MVLSEHRSQNLEEVVKTTRTSSVLDEEYWNFRRIHVHLLVAWGYLEAKPQIVQTDKEDDITDFICQAIERVILSNRAPWCSEYEVHEQKPISGGSRTGPDRRKTDIIIRFLTESQRPTYVFEAKPLNYPKGYQRENNYIDNLNGLGRFIKGEYADYTSNYPEVGMLGYVLSDTPEKWRDRLIKAIDTKRMDLRLRNLQKDIRIIDAFPFEWASEHDRDSANRYLTILGLTQLS